ncbi:nitroreductase family deazaflavin-dependent oxidoreductase [Streptomyces sp. ISL-66]|uniref:nitroreductase/quinone reductase family protein n=1 Tax=Streptomyces sp. ISL-66 TaxID=2819186 RepID=UPI001BED1D0D|nr:nitroreductase/quinone reductase family protein [Streptomyces sp. ISL-66]MBT2471887.1 nitroreductase family deazaflavin-dependent oxidoreductase [Streptomyces sp. ISL-66]
MHTKTGAPASAPTAPGSATTAGPAGPAVDWDHPADPPAGPPLAHVRAYVDSCGTDGHLWHGVPTLLLTTLDRISGRPVRTPLIYGRDGARHIVLATAADGAEGVPSWYRNLAAHPEVRVQVGALTAQARARTATPAERETYWEIMTALWPAYEEHQAAAAPREIPLVIIER